MDLRKHPDFAQHAQPGTARSAHPHCYSIASVSCVSLRECDTLCCDAPHRLCIDKIKDDLEKYSTFRAFARDVRTVFLNALAHFKNVPQNFEIRTRAELLLGWCDSYFRTLGTVAQFFSSELRGMFPDDLTLENIVGGTSFAWVSSRCVFKTGTMDVRLHLDPAIRLREVIQELAKWLTPPAPKSANGSASSFSPPSSTCPPSALSTVSKALYVVL